VTTSSKPASADGRGTAASGTGRTRTVVHLLRHGEVHNPDKILYGRIPGFRLSENGRDQADIVAKALADADLTVVLASPLQRAQETAGPVAGLHGLPIITDDRLIEADNSFEGKRVAVGDGALRRPQYWWRLRDPFTPSWGEPYLEIAERMLAAVHRARELASGHEALCVSHQLPIWTLRRYLTGRHLWHDPRRRQCGLASLTSLVFDDGELVQLRYTEPAGRSDPTQTGA
jgi:broad specificity phosphatase PhoE